MGRKETPGNDEVGLVQRCMRVAVLKKSTRLTRAKVMLDLVSSTAREFGEEISETRENENELYFGRF